MNKKEMAIIAALTLVIAFLDITGIPSSLFLNIQIADIEPIYFSLMVNFVLIGILAYFVLRSWCPDWELGFTKKNLATGWRQYGPLGTAVAIIGFAAFYIGLKPFDLTPSIPKILVEGVVYYIGVAIVEELFVRGLLLNLIERILYRSRSCTTMAVVLSSVLFGMGHIFGVINQSVLVIVSKVIWTIGMGLFFGTIYKKTGNLWLPVILHFLINVCALPYCFSSIEGYANLTLSILVPTYVILGAYSMWLLCAKQTKADS